MSCYKSYCHIIKENVFIGPKIIVDCRHSGNLEKELKLHHHQNGSWNGRMNHRIIEGVGLERTLQPTQLQPPAVGWLPPTKSGCPGPHPAWPWAPPQMHSGTTKHFMGIVVKCSGCRELCRGICLYTGSVRTWSVRLEQQQYVPQ